MNRTKKPEVTWQRLKQEFGITFLAHLLTRATDHDIIMLDHVALCHNHYWRHWCFQYVLEIRGEFLPRDVCISSL
jgi:hypothetical protein